MRRKRPGLFNGWWTDLNGRRIRRIERAEYAELYRLHRDHADIRTNPKRWGGLPTGERP